MGSSYVTGTTVQDADDIHIIGNKILSVLSSMSSGATKTVPSSSSSSGVTGDLATDSSYLYVCVASNSWKRVALTSF